VRPLAALVSLIVPPRCCVCGTACRLDEPLCRACERALRASVPAAAAVTGLELAWSAVAYDGVARDLISALKFAGRLRLAHRAAVAIAEGAPHGLLAGALVPVPAAPGRRRSRGFDPAERIAGALAASTALPLAGCLRRTDAPRQVGRSRAERLGRPPVVRLAGPAPSSAVLVDDVLTTGATLRACAAALRGGGSEHVVAVTFARSGVPSGGRLQPIGSPSTRPSSCG
jgi:predicted amidophosphoribosyltransferase